MGSVSLAIGNAAREAGAHIVTSAEVLMPRNELGLVHKLQFSKDCSDICVCTVYCRLMLLDS